MSEHCYFHHNYVFTEILKILLLYWKCGYHKIFGLSLSTLFHVAETFPKSEMDFGKCKTA